ncbi:hypothetical protein Avbf_14216 [Armadillidium vulgare]|nr:hypothetical protein Avbf_14216 [Armadillidium vulgare]
MVKLLGLVKNGHDESDLDFGLKFNCENKPSVIRNLSNSDWDVPFNLTTKPKSLTIENKNGESNLNERIIECIRKRLVAKFECKFEEDDKARLNEPMGIAQLKRGDPFLA